MRFLIAIDSTPRHAKDRRARRILGRYGWRVAPRTWIVTSEVAAVHIEEEGRRQLSGSAAIVLIRMRDQAETLFEQKEIRGTALVASEKMCAEQDKSFESLIT